MLHLQSYAFFYLMSSLAIKGFDEYFGGFVFMYVLPSIVIRFSIELNISIILIYFYTYNY